MGRAADDASLTAAAQACDVTSQAALRPSTGARLQAAPILRWLRERAMSASHAERAAQGRSERTGAPIAERASAAVDDGSADFARGLADIGLSPRSAWYASLLLWTVGGVSSVSAWLLAAGVLPRGILYAGLLSFAVAAFSLWGALRLGDRPGRAQQLLSHVRLSAGVGIILYGAIVLGNGRLAFALFPLTLIPSACFLFPWKAALPYPIAAAAIVVVCGMLTPGTAEAAHVLVTAGVMLLIAAAILITKQRTRVLAVHNRRLAYTDALTGIANVRSLRERITAECARCGRQGSPFALFAIDLDDFKQVNDRFDHTAGDRVLCAVASALRAQLEPGDLVARRGGDEFSALVLDPGTRDLEELGGRLEAAIRQARQETCPEITPTGTAAYVCAQPGEQLGALIARADDALHRAKQAARRRRLECADGGAPTAGSRPVSCAALPASPAPAAAAPRLDAQRAPTGLQHGAAASLLQAVLRGRPEWRFAAALFAVGGATAAALALAGLVRPLSPAEGLAVAGGHLALILGCLYAGGKGISARWLHIPWLIAYAMIAATTILAGPSGVAFLDFFAAIAMYGFLMFRARIAALYMLLALGAFAALAIAEGYHEAPLTALVTTVVVAEVGAVIAKLREVTVRFARQSRELSEVDELTGVANIRALHHRVERAVRGALRDPGRLAVLAIDLDGFKQVNDRHSHSRGDRVLIAVARALSELTRAEELVARRGGDEFVVVLGDIDAERLQAIAARLQRAIVAARMRTCPDVIATASIAGVQWQPGESADQLLRRADLALHAVKERRRTAGAAA